MFVSAATTLWCETLLSCDFVRREGVECHGSLRSSLSGDAEHAVAVSCSRRDGVLLVWRVGMGHK